MTYSYESEVVKNYFQRVGSFADFYNKERRIYNKLAQLKHRDEGKIPGTDIKIDTDAPGGMNTSLFAYMGASKGTLKGNKNKTIEPYAKYLADLYYNNVKLTGSEKTQLSEFSLYYGFEGIIDFVKEVEGRVIADDYTMDDILITYTVNSLMEGDKQSKLMEVVNQIGLTSIEDIIGTHHETDLIRVLQALLPEVVMAGENTMASISETAIVIPSNSKILWKDLLYLNLTGVYYRGVYRPLLQLDVLTQIKFYGNIVGLNADVILRDDIHRRRFGLQNLMDYWGVEAPYLEVSDMKGYTLYPIIDNGVRIPQGMVEEIYCLWKPPYALYLDKYVLGYVLPVLSKIEFTDKYVSQQIPTVEGAFIACIPQNDVYVPISEALLGRLPSNGDYTNITRFNLGL